VPRGKAKFKTSSPDSEFWPDDPEAAMRDIAERNNATYIEGSLIFSPNGASAEALFKTVEPEQESSATKLHKLARQLDAGEMRLYFDVDRWQNQQED
jgi:hypothetical protein